MRVCGRKKAVGGLALSQTAFSPWMEGVLLGPGPRAPSLQSCQVPCGKSALGSPCSSCPVAYHLLGFTDNNSSLSCLLSLAWVHSHITKESTVTEGCALPNPVHSLDGGNERAHVSLSALEIRLHFRCQRQ